MSDNKTVVSGMGQNSNNPNLSKTKHSSNPYDPTSNIRGTVVPGMDSASTTGDADVTNTHQLSKPIVGFLYSISRTSFGEFWPLQIGPNSIGKNAEADIRLMEGTVSSEHAEIVVRKVKNSIIAAITDVRSTNGTMKNGEPIGFQPVDCYNGDIITIGNNYELLLILIDSDKLNLKPKEEFIQIEDDALDDQIKEPYYGGGTFGGFSPYRCNDGTKIAVKLV